MSRNRFPLPALPYSDDELEPVIDARTVNIHHTGHEKSYYDGLEEALDHLESTRGVQAPVKLRRRMRLGLAQAVTFNAAGAILHKLYWENLCREGTGGNPSKALHDQIVADFGTPAQFVEEFSDVANAIRGSGWAILVYSPFFHRLFILPVENHQNEWIPGAVPLLIVDVWEHAYYLKHANKRADYIRDIWRVINWQVVSHRFMVAVRSSS
jgi:Fe-Mn family superoxide dismutase